MQRIYILALVIFLAAWGGSVLFSYMAALHKTQFPVVDSANSTLYPKDLSQKEAHEIASESEKKRKKTMEDAKYQLKKYLETLDTKR